MNNIKKTLLINLALISTLLAITFAFNKSYSQSSNSVAEDFSDAENAEEKRSKWGTEEFKLELIKEMSSANIALFIDEHLFKYSASTKPVFLSTLSPRSIPDSAEETYRFVYTEILV